MRVERFAAGLCLAVAKTRAVRTIIVVLMLMGIATEGHAQQPDAPVNIPLNYYFDPNNQLLSNEAKLTINVGIQGGEPLPYIFDTGSPVFNAAYGDWWGGDLPVAPTPPAPSPPGFPGSPLFVNNAQFCYGKSEQNDGFCRGWTGNLVQITSLDFYATTSDLTPAATLSAAPGYVMNAGYEYVAQGQIPTSWPNFLLPPMYDQFYGVFGAGNFAPNVQILIDSPYGPEKIGSGYYAGGVLGQTIVSGAMAQGYVVAANGQKNPLSDVNGPQQVNGINVTIGGKKKAVTPCSPCVTVGLTPEMQGQFWAATPTPAANAGVIPWAVLGPPFQNPYDPNSDGNPASKERGTRYKTTLTSTEGTKLPPEKALGLLDTGTGTLGNLESTASQSQIDQVSSSGNDCLENKKDGCAVNAGVTLKVAGVDPTSGQPIQGMTQTSNTVTKDNEPPGSYGTTYDTALKGQAAGQNTIGLPFFTQNSVMYDLTNQVIGYTPFFVTNAPLVTVAGGPLIVDGNNVPLGLAGHISGAGGVSIRDGGAVQLSAENTYTGPTQVSDGAMLFVSGPGSIETSSGVRNDGHFDISRAWSAVSIQNLTGSGKTYLGGQNLIITNASGTFSGTISHKHFEGTLDDGSSYLGFPGTGGGLTLAGGTLTLSGLNTYKGLTWVNQGALIVNGSITSSVAVNFGSLLGGNGSVGATTIGPGSILAPGNSIGTMTLNGDLLLSPGAVYEVEANAQGQSDKVIVNGTVNLTGATLFVLEAAGAYKPKTDYVIIDNDGTDAVNGKFGEVINTLAFLIPSVVYDGGSGNDVVLTLERVSFGSAARTRNHRSVALALDQFATDDPLFLTVLNQTEEGARQAFDALSGEIHATVAGTLANDSRYVREAVLGRLMQASHTGEALSAGGPQMTTYNSQAMMLGADQSLYDGKQLLDAPPPVLLPLAFWTRAVGAWGDFDTDGNAASADRDLGGFISGVDANIGGSWRVGLATGASFSNVEAEARYSSADIETYHLGGYVGGMAGAFAMRGGGMWAWNDIDTSRAVLFPGFYERQTASYDADTGQLFGEVAYPTQMGGIALEPFAGLAYVSIDSEAFRERGGALASLRGAADQDVGYSTVGLRAATTMHWGEMLVTPHISAAWQHAFDDVTPGAALAFTTTGIGFTVAGVPLAEDAVLLDTGLDFAISDRVTAGVSYAGQFGDGVTDNAVKGQLTWLF